MSTTRKQKRRELMAALIEAACGTNQSTRTMRSVNRSVEQRKRAQFRGSR